MSVSSYPISYFPVVKFYSTGNNYLELFRLIHLVPWWMLWKPDPTPGSILLHPDAEHEGQKYRHSVGGVSAAELTWGSMQTHSWL